MGVTKSYVFGFAAIAFFIYAAAVLVQSLITGEKRVATKYRAPFTVTRENNSGSFWFYTGVDVIMCCISAAFAVHFLTGLI